MIGLLTIILLLFAIFAPLHKFQAHFLFHREEFDEEKEPDGMLLSGWTQAPRVEKDDNKTVGNGGSSTSNASSAMPVEAEEDDDIEFVPTGKKRKVGEISKATNPNLSDVADDDDDVLVMLDGENLDINKKKKLQ